MYLCNTMSTQIVRYTIIMEQTPHPDTIKFITNHILLPSGQVLEFDSSKNLNVSPLVKELFSFPFIKQILIAENYISITKQPHVLWDDVLLELRDYIYTYLNASKPVFVENLQDILKTSLQESDTSESITVQHTLPQSEIEQKIIDILNEYILPAVSQDGGFITFSGYKDGVVYLKMRGACNGCPSSIYTLKAGIEALLKKMLPDAIKEVRSE